MAGHGAVNVRRPRAPRRTGAPSGSQTSAATPGSDGPTAPGLVVLTPGSGPSTTAPVSVWPHVSTTGHRPPPTCSRYHSHASGSIGAPVEPSSRSDDRSDPAGTPRRLNSPIAAAVV